MSVCWVRLADNTFVKRSTYDKTAKAVTQLAKSENSQVIYELLKKCCNPNYDYSARPQAQEILKKWKLINDDGSIPKDVKDIILDSWRAGFKEGGALKSMKLSFTKVKKL